MVAVLQISEQLLLLAGALLLVWAALHDVATRTVPNWVSVAMLVAGIGLRILNHQLGWGLLAGLVVFLCAAFCWRRGWMGGADVKLLTASAVLVQPALVASMILAVSLAGGILVFIYLALRLALRGSRPVAGRPDSFLARIRRVEKRRIKRLETLPYASAIAAGALFTLFTV